MQITRFQPKTRKGIYFKPSERMIIFARLFMENGQREVGCKMNDKGNSLLSEICVETDLWVY